MTKLSGSSLRTIMVAIAATAALAIGPPLAVGKKHKPLYYEGPLNIPRNSGMETFPDGSVHGPFPTFKPTIEWGNVIFDGKRLISAGLGGNTALGVLAQASE